jgi:hypothetical protein
MSIGKQRFLWYRLVVGTVPCSGSGPMTRLEERRRFPILQRPLGPKVVVLLPRLPGQRLRLKHACELFPGHEVGPHR